MFFVFLQVSKRFAKSLLWGIILSWCVSVRTTCVHAERPEPHAPPTKITGLIYNLDCAHFFVVSDPATVSGHDVDAMIDFYADAGVKTFVCNISAQRTSYDSDVWQSKWDGYDPEGPDDQPFLRGVLSEEVKSYRKMYDVFAALHEKGIDYPARVIQQCRKRNMGAWLSVRMNDHHGLLSETNPGVSRYLRENPHLSRVPYQKFMRADRALDFAHDEVRERYLLLVDELLTRYDMDGLELDFCRHSLLFGMGRELAGCALMTELVGQVHEMITSAEKRYGHPIHLGVRVPSEPETCRNTGIDVMTWVESGWVDLVVVNGSGVATSSDFNMPIRLWKQLLKPYDVSLAGCTEASVASCHPAAMLGIHSERIDPPLAAGVAATFLHGGADAVYVFNMFREVLLNHPDWTDESIRDTFTAMNSLETVEGLHRRHIVTYREITAPGELLARPPTIRTGELSFVDAALPAKGKYGIFRLKTGPKPEGRKVQVVLGLHESRHSSISIRVNGVPCDLATREQDGDRLLFDVPAKALAEEAHVIEVYANLAGGSPFTITWVEMEIGKAGS